MFPMDTIYCNMKNSNLLHFSSKNHQYIKSFKNQVAFFWPGSLALVHLSSIRHTTLFLALKNKEKYFFQNLSTRCNHTLTHGHNVDYFEFGEKMKLGKLP